MGQTNMLSDLPLSYCTNVHPGRTLAEVRAGLDQYTVPMRDRLQNPVAAGLWLAKPVITELLTSPGALPAFADFLRARSLPCYTLNAFPFGDFHSTRVKENVYLPDWSHPDRLLYTEQCAQVLATLLPDDTDGSISTVPLGFKRFTHPPDFADACIAQLISLARRLDQLRAETGKSVRLAIEPEPLCVLETTSEALNFFEALRRAADRAGAGDIVRHHLGVCYDVCHQSVEFEDVQASIRSLTAAGVRINKVHISCAIEIRDPADSTESLAALERYIEPRYLHQTIARAQDGSIHRHLDLDNEMVLNPPPEFRNSPAWRVHFHVPVDAERLGPLHTTRPDLRRALEAIKSLDYAPHLEVETYTWEVLPNQEKPDLVAGLSREMRATRELLQTL